MNRTYYIDADSDTLIHLVAPTTKTDGNILFVQDIGHFIAHKDFFMRRSSLESYLIQITLGGEGYLEYSGKTYRIPEKYFMWIDCMQPHYYHTSPSSEKWHVIWVHLYGSNSRYYYEQFLQANDGQNVARLSTPSHVSETIWQIIYSYQKFDCDFYTDIHVSALLSDILSECITKRDNGEGAMPAYVLRAKEYILNHYTEQVTLDTLADKLFVSKYYLQRLFCQYMHMSPKEYLCQLRINHAKTSLRKTSLSIQEIAAEVGYNNVSYFINLFRKYEHETPGAYRKRWGLLP